MLLLRYMVKCYWYISKVMYPHIINKILPKQNLDICDTYDTEHFDDHTIMDIDNSITNTTRAVYPSKCNITAIRTYSCGYCNKPIRIPRFMYLDKTFCDVQCRRELILLHDNNSTIL
jgi:hypothetical protein